MLKRHSRPWLRTSILKEFIRKICLQMFFVRRMLPECIWRLRIWQGAA